MSAFSATHMALAVARSSGGDEKLLDAILACCEANECSQCASIICPFDDFMHFHHDGCPTCAEHDESIAGEWL